MRAFCVFEKNYFYNIRIFYEQEIDKPMMVKMLMLVTRIDWADICKFDYAAALILFLENDKFF